MQKTNPNSSEFSPSHCYPGGVYVFTMSTFSSLRWQRVWVQLPTVPVKHARSSPNAARSVGGTLFKGEGLQVELS